MSPQPQTNTPPSELAAALDYAHRGTPVFPTNPLDKKPLTANGFKDATADETQIRSWWQQWPNAMVAAPTGPASGMWVVDLDLDPVKKIDGIATLAQLIAQHGEIPKTLMTITPRGGRHLIFSWDSKAKIRNSAGKIGPGIDVRGEGGYVCLPPSRNANSACYRWDPDGADQAVAAPDWLVELATRSKTRDKAWARAALDHECKAVAAAQPGTRKAAGAPQICGPFGSYAEWSTMVRSPLVWLGEPDPVASMSKNRTEDPEISDILELIDLWLDYDLGLDTPYTTSRIIELACAPPAGFNLPVFKQFLLRVAGDKDGNVSAKRLGEWLRRISGRVVSRIVNDQLLGRYQLVRGQARAGRACFRLSEVT